MKRKIKEKLIKWSRNVDKVERFTKWIALTLLVMLVIIILYNIGLMKISEQTAAVGYILFIITMAIGYVITLIDDILITINSKDSQMVNNMKLSYIVFSNRKITEDIINPFIMICILLPSGILNLIFCWVFILLYIILPKRIEKYCKEKLQE